MRCSGPWHLHLLVDIGFTLARYVALMCVFAVGAADDDGGIRPDRARARVDRDSSLPGASGQQTGCSGRHRRPGMLAWVLVANARILRSALGLTMAACVGLAILQTIAGQLLLLGLFPPPAAS